MTIGITIIPIMVSKIIIMQHIFYIYVFLLFDSFYAAICQIIAPCPLLLYDPWPRLTPTKWSLVSHLAI